MTNSTPPLHPMEREQLHAESTLVVTVKSSSEFHDGVADGIEALDRGETIDAVPTLSFSSYDELMATLTPRVLDLIEAIRHEELSQLAQLDIIFFEEDGQRRRPVVWFDELVISLPFEPEAGDTAAAAP